MPFTLHPNAAIGVVAIAPTPPTSGATLTLQPGQGAKFGAPNVRVAIAPPNVDPIALAAAVEFALMTDCTGDVLTLTRATEGPNGARAIQVGDLVYATPTGSVFEDIEAAIQASGVSTVLRYNWSTATAAPPTSAQVRIDDVPPYTNVSTLWIPKLDDDGIDASRVLLALAANARVLVQDKNDSTLSVDLSVVGDAVDQGSYVEIPVAWRANGGALLDNQACLVVLFAPILPFANQKLDTTSNVQFRSVNVQATPPIAGAGSAITPYDIQGNVANGSISWTVSTSNQRAVLQARTPSNTWCAQVGVWGMDGPAGGNCYAYALGQSGRVFEVGHWTPGATVDWRWDFRLDKSLICPGVLTLTETPYAALPAAAIGTLANVSDSTTATPGQTVAGGGTNHVLARYNGAAWIVVA